MPSTPIDDTAKSPIGQSLTQSLPGDQKLDDFMTTEPTTAPPGMGVDLGQALDDDTIMKALDADAQANQDLYGDAMSFTPNMHMDADVYTAIQTKLGNPMVGDDFKDPDLQEKIDDMIADHVEKMGLDVGKRGDFMGTNFPETPEEQGKYDKMMSEPDDDIDNDTDSIIALNQGDEPNTPQESADQYKLDNPNWYNDSEAGVVDWMNQNNVDESEQEAILDAVRGYPRSEQGPDPDYVDIGRGVPGVDPDATDPSLEPTDMVDAPDDDGDLTPEQQAIVKDDGDLEPTDFATPTDDLPGQSPAELGEQGARDDAVIASFDNFDAAGKKELLRYGGLGEDISNMALSDDDFDNFSLAEIYGDLTDEQKQTFLRNAIDNGIDLLGPGSGMQLAAYDGFMIESPEAQQYLSEDPDLFMQMADVDSPEYSENTVQSFYTEEQAKKAGGGTMPNGEPAEPVLDEDTGLWYANNEEWNNAHNGGLKDTHHIQTFSSPDDATNHGVEDVLLDEKTGLYMTDLDWQRAHGGGDEDTPYHIVLPNLEGSVGANPSDLDNTPDNSGPNPANFTDDEKDAVLSQGIPEEDVSDFMAGQGNEPETSGTTFADSDPATFSAQANTELDEWRNIRNDIKNGDKASFLATVKRDGGDVGYYEEQTPEWLDDHIGTVILPNIKATDQDRMEIASDKESLIARVSEAEDCGCKNTFEKAIEVLSR